MCVVEEVVVVVVVVLDINTRQTNEQHACFTRFVSVSVSVYAKAIKMYGKKFAI